MESKKIPVIVCGGATGRPVIYARVDAVPEPGEVVHMFDARMVLRWREPRGLFGLASVGPSHPETRITVPVAEVRDTCRQVLLVTPEAAAALDGWPHA